MPASTCPIVVPLDGSRKAENALPHAALLSTHFEAPVHLLHVIDAGERHESGDLSHAREAFAPYATALAERHGAHVYGLSLHVARGDAATEILDYAGGQDAQFIVLASHGRGGFRATLVGSVADKVARASNIPVLMVPGTSRVSEASYGQVLVALDGSPEAEEALVAGRDLASRAGAKTSLVRAYQVPLPVVVDMAYLPTTMIEESLEQDARDYLASVATGGEGQLVIDARPAWAVQRAAERIDADLVVVASRRKGPLARIALGSVTNELMHQSHRPLLIVPID